MQNWRWK